MKKFVNVSLFFFFIYTLANAQCAPVNTDDRTANADFIPDIRSRGMVVPPMTTSKAVLPPPATNKITIGSNPDNGNFWFSVSGLDEESIATLFYIDGKQIKEFKMTNLQQVHVNNLRRGLYILSIPGFEPKKIIVNGGESFTANKPTGKNTGPGKLSPR